MRFCLVTTFFPPEHFGGDAVFVANLANVLVGAGHEVDVIHCADSFNLLKNAVRPSEVTLDSRVTVHTLRSNWGALSPIATHATGRPIFQSAELARIFSKGFDVTHWHNLSLLGGPGAVSLGSGVQLCTLHDYWWICPTSILFKYNREACEQRTCFRCTLAHRRPYQLWRSGSALANAAKRIHRFLAPSEFVRRKYADSSLNIAATVLPHFVSGPAYSQEQPKEDYYLFVGRLELAKGLQTIIPLFGETGRRLLIAGGGNAERELREQASPYSSIQFLGRVNHAELPSLYAGARATIVPSICYETFGLTLLESLQQATPVIVSDFGAPKEIIAATGGGAVFHDLADLRQILDSWDHAPDTASRLGVFGSSNLSKYSEENHLKQYFEMIDSHRREDSR